MVVWNEKRASVSAVKTGSEGGIDNEKPENLKGTNY